MTRHVSRLIALALAIAALVATGATNVRLHAAPSGPAVGQQGVPVFGAETSQVLVDVVVRDRKGRLVRDLSASDFEVYEDRAKQTISNFRVVALAMDRASDSPAAAAAPSLPSASPEPAAAPSLPAPHPTPAASQSGPAVIAFVFDRLSPKARDIAHKAALAYSDKGHVSGDLVGVFSVDVASVHVLQPFTGDVAAIRAAFDRAGRQPQAMEEADFRSQSRDHDQSAQDADTRIGALSAAGIGNAGTAQAVASLAVQEGFDVMQSRILASADRLGRDQEGFASTNALMSVVNGLKALPGRKTIVFFSEGLQLSSNVLGEFRSVIANANRANVTVYAIDAGGLRVDSTIKDARAEVVAMGERRIHQEERGGVGSVGDRPMTEGLERAEDAVRENPHVGLGQLAEETGGFLLANTNDASQGFERIQEEMRFYYLLSYSPTNAAFDGSYRSISVKVNRPGVSIYTRKGYLAVRPDTVVPVRGYEAPVIAVLERVPRPKDLPLHATALSFPEGKRLGRVPVMVEVPASSLSFVQDPKKKVYQADFSIVARVRDWQGREVDRLGRHYPLTIPADQIEATKRGDVLFFQETDLPAGRYTLEAAVYDGPTQKASVAIARVEVAAAEEGGPRLSSLVLLRKIEKLTAAEQARDNPLHYGETIVYPNMERPYSKAAVPAVGFFFTVYPDDTEPLPTQATIEILKDGRPTARTGTPLGAPDQAGRIQQAGALPLERLAPGAYTLKISVPSGAEVVSRQADFVVEP
jgi:VWFA-related protein